MNDTQLIDRLRATYAAVAEQTPDDLVAPVGAVVPVEPIRERRRGGRFLAAAAALVVVLVGIAVLSGRDDGPAAGSIEALADRLRHAGLGFVPEGFGLVTIETTDNRDRLVFTDGTRELQIVTERGVEPSPGDVPVRGRLGTIATQGDRIELRWPEREGVTIAVVGTGGWTEDELVEIADTVVTVSDEAWEQLTQRSGFADLPLDQFDVAVYDRDLPGIAVSDDDLTRSTSGTLQGGLRITLGCCESKSPLAVNAVLFRTIPGVHLVTATDEVARVEIVHDGELLGAVQPIADPALPTSKIATVDIGSGAPRGTVARFFAVDGRLIETVVVR